MEFLKTVGIILLVIILLPVIFKVVLGFIGITVSLLALVIRFGLAVLVIYLIYRGVKAVMED